MDKQTLENLELLEKLGYYYETKRNSFWSAANEAYIGVPLAHCNDLVRVLGVIINYEKQASQLFGEGKAKQSIRSAPGL